jgi:Ni/Co efflux regulator RcnB
MKRILLGAAAAAMALTASVASAQPYGDHHDWNRGGRSYDSGHRYDGGNRYSGNRYDGNRHDGNRYGGNRYDGGHRWRTGERYSYYRDRGRMISDWGRYHLPPPRAGYAYYYDDNGDVVMAALASGIIGMVLGNAIADQPQPYYAPGAYAAPAYPYSYGYPY